MNFTTKLENKISLALKENNLFNTTLPSNIYAICIEWKGQRSFLKIEHDGIIPNMSSEREMSRSNDYLSNLETALVSRFFKANQIKKNTPYSNVFEILTNKNGVAEHISYSQQYINSL